MTPVRWIALAGGALLALTAQQAFASRNGEAFLVMTFNVLFESKDIEKSVEAIDSSGVDVVCLQELTPEFAKAFNDRLGSRYPHRAFTPKTGTWGIGLASRHPLSAVKVFEQSPNKMPAVEARVRVGKKDVTLSCVHFYPAGAGKRDAGFLQQIAANAETRVKQAETVLARYEKVKGPLLVLGDFNEDANGKAVEVFTHQGFVNACRASNSQCGPTWPGATSVFPAVVQIDHVLGRELHFDSAQVVKSGGSDHYPVVAAIDL